MWLGMRDAARGLRSASVAGEEVNLKECPRHERQRYRMVQKQSAGTMPDREVQMSDEERLSTT